MTLTRLIVGCGYLGQRVAALWHARGDRVVATVRSAPAASTLRALGIEPVVCNVLDPRSLAALPRADTILYSVGYDPAGGASRREVAVVGLLNALTARPCCGRFIYTSSTGVYGGTDGEEVDEETPAAPVDDSGRILLEAEQTLLSRLPEAIILRLAGLYGPGRVPSVDRLRSGELPGDPDAWLNLIHVDDAAAAVLAAAERGVPGRIYNVCDGRPVRRRDFYDFAAKLLGLAPPRFIGGTTSRRPGLSRRVSSRRAFQELDLRPAYPTFEEGLAALCAVARQHADG